MAVGDNNRRRVNNASADSPHFEVGDTVIDRDGDGSSTAQVVSPDVGRADQVEIGNTGKSVNDKNEGYPADDRVVRVAFDSDLQILPDSEDGAIAEQIEQYRRNWGVEIRTYDYPESRLASATKGSNT
jgi:hypothetical protein